MVVKFIDTSDGGLNKAVTSEKLHSNKAWKITKAVKKRFDEIILKIQTGWIVYVDPKKLKDAAKNLKKRNPQKQAEVISIDNPHPELYDKRLTSEQIAEIRWDREWVVATKHFYDKTKPPLSFHGYIFYANMKDWESKEVVACIYEFAGREYIILDKRIAQHPISGDEFVMLLKGKYNKIHKKHNATDWDYPVIDTDI